MRDRNLQSRYLCGKICALADGSAERVHFCSFGTGCSGARGKSRRLPLDTDTTGDENGDEKTCCGTCDASGVSPCGEILSGARGSGSPPRGDGEKTCDEAVISTDDDAGVGANDDDDCASLQS